MKTIGLNEPNFQESKRRQSKTLILAGCYKGVNYKNFKPLLAQQYHCQSTKGRNSTCNQGTLSMSKDYVHQEGWLQKKSFWFSSGFLGGMIKSFKLWWLIYDADAVSPDFSWSTSSGKCSVPHSYSAIICHISKGKAQLAHFSAQSYFNWQGLQIMCLRASVFRRWVCPKPLECFCPIQKEKYLCL